MLRDASLEPKVIEYLKTPPTRDELVSLLRRMGKTPRQILRRKEKPFDELGLDDPSTTDDSLIDAILAHPILLERPIDVTQGGVTQGGVTQGGVRLRRPAEAVVPLLD